MLKTNAKMNAAWRRAALCCEFLEKQAAACCYALCCVRSVRGDHKEHTEMVVASIVVGEDKEAERQENTREEAPRLESAANITDCSENDVIGEGAYGIVRSKIGKDGNRYAVKTIPLIRTSIVAVLREIEIHRNVNGHKNIIGIGQVIIDNTNVHICMSHGGGCNLIQYVCRQKNSAKIINNVMKQITSGLSHIHDMGYAHRDIKPDNVLIDDTSAAFPVCRLCDFGLSVHKCEFTCDSVGTESFCAPEVLEGFCYCGQSADMWSLGILCVGISFMHIPFERADVTCFAFRRYDVHIQSNPPSLALAMCYELFGTSWHATVRAVTNGTLHISPSDRLTSSQLLTCFNADI